MASSTYSNQIIELRISTLAVIELSDSTTMLSLSLMTASVAQSCGQVPLPVRLEARADCDGSAPRDAINRLAFLWSRRLWSRRGRAPKLAASSSESQQQLMAACSRSLTNKSLRCSVAVDEQFSATHKMYQPQQKSALEISFTELRDNTSRDSLYLDFG